MPNTPLLSRRTAPNGSNPVEDAKRRINAPTLGSLHAELVSTNERLGRIEALLEALVDDQEQAGPEDDPDNEPDNEPAPTPAPTPIPFMESAITPEAVDPEPPA